MIFPRSWSHSTFLLSKDATLALPRLFARLSGHSQQKWWVGFVSENSRKRSFRFGRFDNFKIRFGWRGKKFESACPLAVKPRKLGIQTRKLIAVAMRDCVTQFPYLNKKIRSGNLAVLASYWVTVHGKKSSNRLGYQLGCIRSSNLEIKISRLQPCKIASQFRNGIFDQMYRTIAFVSVLK